MPVNITECPGCGSSQLTEDRSATRSIGLSRPFKIVKCRGCRLRLLSPAPTSDEYDSMYAMIYHDGDSTQSGLPGWMNGYPLPPGATRRSSKANGLQIAHRHAQILSELRRGSGESTLLEIGCGEGAFLRAAQEKGWNVKGLEPSRSACTALTRDGLDVANGTLESTSSWATQFDVVVLLHVFEHFTNPSESWKRIRRLVAPGGVAYIEVPNQFESWAGVAKRILRRRGPSNLFSVHHPTFFDARTLKQVLSTGTDEVQVRSDIQSYFLGDGAVNLMKRTFNSAASPLGRGATLSAIVRTSRAAPE